ncbi:MAG: ferritin, partial [Alistipes sp.]|nr:ferritin [Alistipes sp.]
VKLAPIAEVETEWDTPLAMFEQTLEHEKKVTSLIHNLCAIAAEEKDVATANRMIWFVDEQVEEEESARDIIDQLKFVGDDRMGLYMIDKELATRVYTTPSPLATAE